MVTKPVSLKVQRLRQLLEPPFDELRVIGIFPIMVSLSNHALTLTERLYFLSNPQSDLLPRYNIRLKWKGLDFKDPFTPV